MTTSKNALAVASSDVMALVLPAYQPEQVKEMMKAYQEMCEAVIDKKTDIQVIGGKDHKKKSACRKLDVAYNISHGEDLLADEKVDLPNGEIGFKVRVIAVHPKTGRTAIGDGWCDTIEKPLNYIDQYGNPATRKLHDLRGTAATRAMNRSTLNLVGMGEVSAEEIGGHHDNGESHNGEVSGTVDKPGWDVKKWCDRHGVDSHHLDKYKDDREHTTKKGSTYHWYKGIPASLWKDGPGEDGGGAVDAEVVEDVGPEGGDPWGETKPPAPLNEPVSKGGTVKPKTFPGKLDCLSAIEVKQISRKAEKSGTDLTAWLILNDFAEREDAIPREKAAEIHRRLDALLDV